MCILYFAGQKVGIGMHTDNLYTGRTAQAFIYYVVYAKVMSK